MNTTQILENISSIDPQQFEFVKACINAGKELNFKIVSGSMEPLIRVGDQVEIKPVKIEKLKKFDIIIFHQTDKLICHYVRHINHRKFNDELLIITQGLNSKGEDFPVRASQVLGLVTSHRLSLYSKLKFYSKLLIR